MNRVLLALLIISVNAFSQERTFLALGDSYTIGESVAVKDRWPMQLVAKLKENGYEIAEPVIVAKTGWRTDQLKAAIQNTNLNDSYDLVGLLIGVNNQYQGRSVESYRPEFEELLSIAIEKAGGDKSKVFVMSIPDYGYTPFGKTKRNQISRQLDEYNGVNKHLTEKYGIQYFDITDISRSSDQKLVASDNLHPSGYQYNLWVEKMMKEDSFFVQLR